MRRWSTSRIFAPVFLIVFLLLNGTLRAIDFSVERISVSSLDIQANNRSYYPSISGDGHFVAFYSLADNLVPNDTNGDTDVFVRNVLTGETILVSVSSLGVQGNIGSAYPSISADGHFVALESPSSNLVVGGTNGAYQVFIHNMLTGETSLVSVSSLGVEGNGQSGSAAISGDGRFVAFDSLADNLVVGDTNNVGDVFVHDMQTGDTKRVSVSSLGIQANSGSGYPSISDDGRFVVFASSSNNLVASDTNGRDDVFVHDLQTVETVRVSVSSNGSQATAGAEDYASISGDGRFIAFVSHSSNLVLDDTSIFSDVFVHDRVIGETTRVSVSSLGTQGNTESSYGQHRENPSISSDGRFVAFNSYATNLVTGDTNGTWDVFVNDRQTGETTRISVSSGGTQGNADSQFPEISQDGRFVAFSSGAFNLVPSDTNATADIFRTTNTLFPAPPPDPPNAAPSRNYFTALPLMLTWNPASGVIGYQVQVAKDNSFAPASIVKDLTTPADQLYVTISTIANGDYFWRVCGRISLTKCGAWSTPDSFTVVVP